MDAKKTWEWTMCSKYRHQSRSSMKLGGPTYVITYRERDFSVWANFCRSTVNLKLEMKTFDSRLLTGWENRLADSTAINVYALESAHHWATYLTCNMHTQNIQAVNAGWIAKVYKFLLLCQNTEWLLSPNWSNGAHQTVTQLELTAFTPVTRDRISWET